MLVLLKCKGIFSYVKLSVGNGRNTLLFRTFAYIVDAVGERGAVERGRWGPNCSSLCIKDTHDTGDKRQRDAQPVLSSGIQNTERVL